MKVGVDSYCYHRLFGEVYPNQRDPGRRWQFDQCIDEVLRIGADGISLETCFMPGFDHGYLSAVKERLDARGLERVLAWGHPDGLEGGRNTAAARELEERCAAAQALGAKVMRIVGSSLTFRHEPHEPQIRAIAGLLKESVKIAADHDVRLAIENHIDFTADEILEILSVVDSEYLGVNFDSGNALRMFEDPVVAARKLAPHTYATHIKDIVPTTGSPRDWTFWASAPAGGGILDMPGVIQALLDGGYEGMLCVEVDFLKDPAGDETKAVEEAVHYLRTLCRTLAA